jgi:hypothetical protein
MSKVGAFSPTPVMPRSLTGTESTQRPVASQDVSQQSPTGHSLQDSFESAPKKGDLLTSLRTTSPDGPVTGGPSNGTGHFRKIGPPVPGGGE